MKFKTLERIVGGATLWVGGNYFSRYTLDQQKSSIAKLEKNNEALKQSKSSQQKAAQQKLEVSKSFLRGHSTFRRIVGFTTAFAENLNQQIPPTARSAKK